MFRSQIMKEYQKKHDEAMENFKQKTLEELYTEDYKAFTKVSKICALSLEKLMEAQKQRIVTVGMYVVWEFSKFGFSAKDISIVQ